MNQLILRLRSQLQEITQVVGKSARSAIDQPEVSRLQTLLMRKEQAHGWVQAIEQIWDFYFELFGQRQSRFGN